MPSDSGFRLKIASDEWEFEAIHRLNHQTFAEEIPRYEPTASGRLVDRFHDENAYAVALRDRRLVGMVAIRSRRPFALDERVTDLDSYLPSGRSMCELRLLAVDPGYRMGRVAPVLFEFLWQYCSAAGFDLALISGFTRQLKLYSHVGFVPFGPLVGTADAMFQPMMLTLERFAPRVDRVLRSASRAGRRPT